MKPLTISELDRQDYESWSMQISRLERYAIDAPKGDNTAAIIELIDNLKREIVLADPYIQEHREIPARIRESIEDKVRQAAKLTHLQKTSSI